MNARQHLQFVDKETNTWSEVICFKSPSSLAAELETGPDFPKLHFSI